MRVDTDVEQGEDEDSEVCFGSKDLSGPHCERKFGNTFPTEHDCSQRRKNTSAEHHLRKEQDSNGGPKDKPSHANKVHTTNSSPQNHFPEMFPGISLRFLFHMISLLSNPSV